MANPDRPNTDEFVATSWGRNVADAVVRAYPNAATRDADLAGFTPADLLGQVAYLEDIGELQVYASALVGWRRPWNQAWGAQSVGVNTTSGTLPPAFTELVRCAAFHPLGNRVYEITVEPYVGIAPGATVTLQLGYHWEGQSRVVRQWDYRSDGGTTGQLSFYSQDNSPGNGPPDSGAYALWAMASGTVFIAGTHTIFVNDIGSYPHAVPQVATHNTTRARDLWLPPGS